MPLNKETKPEKINTLLTNIPTNNGTELSWSMQERNNSVMKSIFFLRNMKRNSKPGWEFRLKTPVMKFRQQTKTLRKGKHWICWDEKTKHIYIYIYIYIYHHVMPPALISLTLSRHFSLSSGLHPVSSHRCCMYVRAGRPAFARP